MRHVNKVQSCSCTLTALAVVEFERSDKQANMHESMSVLAWVPQRDANMLQMILGHIRSAGMHVFSADYCHACRVLHDCKTDHN